MPSDKVLLFCNSLVYFVYMLFELLFMFTMCLHPRYEITQQESIRDLESLEEFDQCDYVYSLNDVDIDDLVVLQLNI